MGVRVRIVDGKVVADKMPTSSDPNISVVHSMEVKQRQPIFGYGYDSGPTIRRKRTTARRTTTQRPATTRQYKYNYTGTGTRTPLTTKELKKMKKYRRKSKMPKGQTTKYVHLAQPAVTRRRTTVRKTIKRKPNRVQRKSNGLTLKRNIVYGATKAKRRSLTDDLW